MMMNPLRQATSKKLQGSALRMEFRHSVNTGDLSTHGSLHGGCLMKWIVDAACMHAKLVVGTECVTRYIGRIDFVDRAHHGEVIRIETIVDDCGTSSFALRVYVKDERTGRRIANIDKVVFVAMNEDGETLKHGMSISDVYGI